jgi:hypothetical protein
VGIALDGAGHLIVAEWENHRIQILRYSDGSHVQTIGEQGSGNLQFNGPRSVVVDGQGRIIVVDSCNHRIQVLQ